MFSRQESGHLELPVSLDLNPEGIAELVLERFGGVKGLRTHASAPQAGEPYGRKVLLRNDRFEVMLAQWAPGVECAPHDHGMSDGCVKFVEGSFIENYYKFDREAGLVDLNAPCAIAEGTCVEVNRDEIHSCVAPQGGLSLHVYSPPISRMRVFDLPSRSVLTVSDDSGAWLPSDSAQILLREPWRTGLRPVAQPKTILILYTTLYRTGGQRFERAAVTMEHDKRREHPEAIVIRKAVESKQAFLAEVAAIESRGDQISEFHFIGHSGVYGIMFGTDQWPEQFSPYEWKQMKIPFAPEGKFFFHSCRSGRWFAPFIAQTFKVKAYGYHWYTTFSAQKAKFKWLGYSGNNPESIYVMSCAGKKSHGLLASLVKYIAAPKPFPMLEFAPLEKEVDHSYDSVAEMYDETFQDIGVRKDEWKWLTEKMGSLNGKSIVDIGCGNGALLRKLSIRAGGDLKGFGVDASEGMIRQAEQGCQSYPNLAFKKISGPALPFPDNSIDCVTSLLSFRYLDWDPILKEILRVLKPGGQVLIVDMVAAPVKLKEVPALLWSKIRGYFQRALQPGYYRALKKMVTDPRWGRMLKYNPIRAEHEMKWYLESRFPGSKVQVINVGWKSRVLAFHSGPVSSKTVEPMQFP